MIIKEYKVNIPKNYINFVKEISNFGIESYFVGGCVRDSLLGIESLDFDIFCKCNKEVFLSKIEGKYTIISEFDNVLIIEDHNEIYTISFNENFECDFNLRDITINSFYYNWQNDKIFGFEKSFDDLDAEVIAPCNSDIFSKDSLKKLRAIRFYNKLNFYFDLVSVIKIDFKDIDSKFLAYRLRNEYYKHDISNLAKFRLNKKILDKLTEFNILI